MQSLDEKTRNRWILALCCLAQFMVILDVSVVNVALPSIRRALGFSTVDLQWVVNAYTLTFAGFLLLGGRAADLLGDRRVFIAGLTLFGVASLAGGLSSSQGMLIVARGVQGLGGAIVAPVTLSVLTTTFREGSERNHALALWGAMGGVGGAAGVLLGGVLTQLLGWEWILFINVPIAVGAAWAAHRLVAATPAVPKADRLYDVAGALSVTAGLVILTFAIVRTDTQGWGSAQTIALLALGVALLVAFAAIEGRLAKRPLVPLRIFASRTLTMSNVVVFFLGCSVFAMWYFVSLYLQQVLGYSAIEAGLAFLPMTVCIIAASTVSGRISARVGSGLVLTIGMGLIGVGMLLFSPLSADGGYFSDIFVPSLITATGLGLAFVSVTITALQGVERAEAGLASGLINTSRQFGGSLGLAVLATIAGRASANSAHGGAIDGHALTAGFHVAFLVGGAFALAGALVSGTALTRRAGARTAA
ncbi:MAG: drug resistance transporter, EmrB/QacA subfamily, partial [Solirubrobacteraceae bacterium]|nr:drug resistance transporter, EmrB/QacA subfamily [Solirubrobacteraceae bacterium]